MDYTGQKLEGRYLVIKRLGYGGMGAVYRGHHVHLDRHVAIKFLHADLAEDEEMIKRFFREAKAAAAIKHDNIIDVLDVGTSPDGEPYLVMEYLQGESLAAMLHRHGHVDVSVASGVLIPALKALVAAHAKSIVHRDLKPDNIFLVDRADQPPLIKLIDFGISKFTRSGDTTQLTKAGSVLGTPAYMSPEQVRGEKGVDHRADIYAMGAILYEMLTGQLPFGGSNYMELLESILITEPKRPSELNPTISSDAEAVALRALSKQATDRYQTAGAMLEELELISKAESRESKLSQIMSGIAKRTFAGGDLGVDALADDTGVVSTDTPGVWTGVAPARKRWGLYLGLVGLGAVLAVVIVGGVLLAGSDGESDADGGKSVATSAPASGKVMITVEGAPRGAKVYYREMLIPMNPFPVEQGDTIVPLKIEAEGYETFTVALIPSEDRTVEVSLTALAEAGEKAAAESKVEEPVETAAAEKPQPKPKPEKKSAPSQVSKKAKQPAPSTVEVAAPSTEADPSSAPKKKKKKKALKKKGKSGEFAGSFE